MKNIKICIILLIIMHAQEVVAQSACPAQIDLDNLPGREGNGLYYNDVFSIVDHPSLSLNGFTCSEGGHSCSEGYGLKEILEYIFTVDEIDEIEDVYELILDHPGSYTDDPNSYGEVRRNTSILQAQAFIALATFVLDQEEQEPDNSWTMSDLNECTGPNLPSHSAALTTLKTHLTDLNSWFTESAYLDDPVKWATALTNIARAIDLYIALENAYLHYGISTSPLLSLWEKYDVLDEFQRSMFEIENMLATQAAAYYVQPNNWSLKIQVALGYAALTQQVYGGLGSGDEDELEAFVERAFHAAGAPTDEDRDKIWNYQSDSGKRFWAEGPYYFHLTLSQVIPFWHTARINNLISSNLNPYSIPNNPFASNTFLTRPLHWLADITTPDGRVPPIDDSNKGKMYNSSILRWSAGYGDGALGEKFAWINEAEANDGGGIKGRSLFDGTCYSTC